MYCQQCGSPLPDGAKFCGNCGSKTDPDASVPFSAEQAPASPAPVESSAGYAAGSYSPPRGYAPASGSGSSYAQGASYSPSAPPYAPGAAMYASTASEPMSVGQYLILMLLMCIPLANIILLFMWAFGSSVNLNRKNLSRAILIVFGATLLLWLVFGVIIGGLLSRFM